MGHTLPSVKKCFSTIAEMPFYTLEDAWHGALTVNTLRLAPGNPRKGRSFLEISSIVDVELREQCLLNLLQGLL